MSRVQFSVHVEVYKGQFQNDLFHGQGTLELGTAVTQEGMLFKRRHCDHATLCYAMHAMPKYHRDSFRGSSVKLRTMKTILAYAVIYHGIILHYFVLYML